MNDDLWVWIVAAVGAALMLGAIAGLEIAR